MFETTNQLGYISLYNWVKKNGSYTQKVAEIHGDEPGSLSKQWASGIRLGWIASGNDCYIAIV